MKTVESVKLFFKDEKSDKVYEVDLCAVEDDLYVVNFRYGRRGAALREGSKTVFPVAYDEAKKTYDALVLSKTSKGYHTGDGDAKVTPKPQTSSPNEQNDRDKTILRHLRDAVADNYSGRWKLSRVIWRAGELQIAESASNVAKLIKVEDSYLSYSAIWTLTKLGSVEGHKAIYDIYKTIDPKTKTHRFAIAHLLDINGSKTEEINKDIELRIPTLLLPIIKANNVKNISDAINDFVLNAGNGFGELVVNLYHLSGRNRSLHHALHSVLESVPTEINYFRALRHILKLAELKSDYLFFGLIAKKIYLNQSNYNAKAQSAYINGQYINVWKHKFTEDSRLSFSTQTKNYLSKRIFRLLNKVSLEQPDAYAKLATGVLLSVSDETDHKNISKEVDYSYDYNARSAVKTETWFPKYDNYTAYLSILYSESDRLEPNNKASRWHFKDGQHEHTELELGREERNQHLWDQSPHEIIELLSKGRVEEVLNMALKVFKANPSFENELADEFVIAMVGNLYTPISNLGVEILEKRYLEKVPSLAIIIFLLNSPSEKGMTLGLKWLEQYKQDYLKSTSSICQLILLGKVEVLEYLKVNLPNLVDETLEKVLFSQIAPIVYHPENYSLVFMDALIAFVKEEKIATLFSALNENDIKEIVNSEDLAVLKLGITLIQINNRSTYDLSSGIIDRLLSSEEDEIRALGLALLAEYPESYLIEHNDVILDYCFSEYPEIRAGVEPIALRLTSINSEFKDELFSRLIGSISQAETYEGLHESNLVMLNNLYQVELHQLSHEKIMDMLSSSIDVAQRLGEEQYLSKNLRLKLTLEEHVEMSKCDVLSIREEVKKYFNENIDLIRSKLETSLRILESNWLDMRTWAFDFFLEKTNSEDWDLDLVLFASDNPKDDVQAFGRSLISKLFSSEHGEKLMLSLSEHPSKNMMLFTSNYLALHAKDNKDVIIALYQYFKNVVFCVNTGAISKVRVFDFLKTEALKNKEVADMVVRLLNEILLTDAKGDKSKCIDILLSIKEQFAEISIPIAIKPITPYEHVV